MGQQTVLLAENILPDTTHKQIRISQYNNYFIELSAPSIVPLLPAISKLAGDFSKNQKLEI